MSSHGASVTAEIAVAGHAARLGHRCVDVGARHRVLRGAIAGGWIDRRGSYALAARVEVEEMKLFSAAMLRFDNRQWDDTATVRAAADEDAMRRGFERSGLYITAFGPNASIADTAVLQRPR